MKSLILLSTFLITLNAQVILPNSFQSNFEQTITSDSGQIINYKGLVYFQDLTQSLFKWNYSEPSKKEVCTDGIQLIVVDHDLEQISNYQVNEGINLQSILNVATKISGQSYKAVYQEIEYLIVLDTLNQLEQIVYTDSLDNNVKIIFNNMNYNVTLDMSLLECTAPSEYDIIKG